MRSGATTLWVADHHLLADPHLGAQGICWKAPKARPSSWWASSRRSPKAAISARPTASSSRCPTGPGGSIASRPASTRPTPGPRTARAGPPATSTATRTWRPLARSSAASRREQGGYVFSSAEVAIQAAKSLGAGTHAAGQHRRPQGNAQGPQGRPADCGNRAEERREAD